MREIIFRGKRVDNGEWVYGQYVFANGNSKMLIDRTSSKPSEWVYEDICINNHLIVVFTPPDRQGWDYGTQFDFYKCDPDTIGQFTGLLDKNGTKIFEGDIVFNSNRTLLTLKEDTRTYLVRWLNGKYDKENTWLQTKPSFEFEKINPDGKNYMSLIFNQSQIEVIGNIHEGGHP
jgi:uncharacterized phage protein (TIGR01671 family)